MGLKGISSVNPASKTEILCVYTWSGTVSTVGCVHGSHDWLPIALSCDVLGYFPKRWLYTIIRLFTLDVIWPSHFFSPFFSFMSLFFSILECVFGFSFAGYVTRGCSQPEDVDLTLKILVSAAPIILIIIGLLILYTYPITEEKRQGNRKLLQELRCEKLTYWTHCVWFARV